MQKKVVYYVALKYDYAQPEKGFSYEYDNMECGFVDWARSRSDIELKIFHPDVDGEMESLRNAPLADCIFHVPFTEAFDLPLEVAISHIKSDKIVVAWDCDASYRFHNWILPRKDRNTHFISTHNCTLDWYKQNNMKCVKSQWGGAPSHYFMPDATKKYDVSFIGQCHGIRPQIMQGFYDAGIRVHLFGDYWEKYPDYHGRLKTVEDVVSVFNETKVNLNLQNPWAIGTPPQIKGRVMQIPQCGAFQLSTPADDLESYFENYKEIVIVNTLEDLIKATQYYLVNDNEREKIANAGHARMIRDHSWRSRFVHMFKEIGLIND